MRSIDSYRQKVNIDDMLCVSISILSNPFFSVHINLGEVMMIKIANKLF
jgi:hypothetical protein